MRWHKSNIKPAPERNDSHFIIKTKTNKCLFVLWSQLTNKFYDKNFVSLSYSLDDIDEWCYVEEDD